MTNFTMSSEEKELSPCLHREDKEKPTMWRSKRNVCLDVLMAFWGLGSWLGVNGLYVQLPLLVDVLPEGWALPASMVVAVQLANLGPLLYALIRKFRPDDQEPPYIYLLLGTGALSLLLNAFLYPQTMILVGRPQSVAFLALTFFTALVGCSSSVLFYPYLRHFRDIYLTTYLVGEGLSGFIPSILSLIQGVGGELQCVKLPDNSTVEVRPEPLFGSPVFLLVLSTLAALSLASFVMLERGSMFRSERVATSAADKREEAAEGLALTSARWLTVLSLVVVLNALMNGVLPSIAPFACLPYGVRAYHLAVTLGALVSTSACLLGVWVRPLPARGLGVLLVCALPALVLVLVEALYSPERLVRNAGGGAALVVVCWVVLTGAVSYGRMWALGWARRGGARGMRAAGTATQIGSAVGSLVLFLLINYTSLFTRAPQCPAS